MTQIIEPRILVLEGLYADTAAIVSDAGGRGIEASPWRPDDVAKYLKPGHIEGIILTGGTDVNPARYGEKPCPVTQSPDYVRDATELQVLEFAKTNKIPVLGICRGSQIMCVSRGGRLCQDIQLYTDAWGKHNGTEHWVKSAGPTFKRAICGDSMEAMSLHHQCVEYPGTGMRIAAMGYDGVPEAIESKDGLMLGVQFHPEMSAYSNPQAFAIFRWLVETAARRAGGKANAANFLDAQEDHRNRLAFAYSSYAADSTTSSSLYSESDNASSWGYPGYPDFEDDAPGTTGKSASNPAGRTIIAGRKYIPRKAGDPSIPSMRTATPNAMVRLIEESTGQRVIVCDANGQAIVEDGEGYEIVEPEFDYTADPLDSPPLAYPSDTTRSGYLDDDAVDRAIMNTLLMCPTCSLRFDLIEDCDDHKKFVHPQGTNNPYKPWHERFAEMTESPTAAAERKEAKS